MKLEDCLPTNTDFIAVAGANDVGAAKSLLNAAKIRRDKERDQVENRPKRDDNNLKNDLVFKLGAISALNWLIDLPGKARAHQNNLPEGD